MKFLIQLNKEQVELLNALQLPLMYTKVIQKIAKGKEIEGQEFVFLLAYLQDVKNDEVAYLTEEITKQTRIA